MKHRYTLEPYKTIKSRYRCPACGKAHCFSRYIDTHTGEHLADHVGRCNREISCAYHFTPRKFHEQNGMFTSARPGKTTFTRREHKKPFQRERSEEDTSELQSRGLISYAAFCFS